MVVAPCKDCERKGCGEYHSQCEKYHEFQREIQRVSRMRKEATGYRPTYAKAKVPDFSPLKGHRK